MTTCIAIVWHSYLECVCNGDSPAGPELTVRKVQTRQPLISLQWRVKPNSYRRCRKPVSEGQQAQCRRVRSQTCPARPDEIRLTTRRVTILAYLEVDNFLAQRRNQRRRHRRRPREWV